MTTTRSTEPTKLMDFPAQRLEAWTKYDESADIYEIFASEECDDYIGCADTLPEARLVATDWARESNC